MKNSGVFRKASLDRLASPEQLDKLLQVTRPRGWIALVALGFLVGSAVLWGFEGSIPSRVAGQGILLKSGGVLEIAAGAGGRITDVAVNVGDVVREGQVVARVAQPDVLNRIRQVRLALDNLRVEHRLVAAHSEEEAALQLAQLGQRREGIDQSIAAAEDSLRWQREKIAAQQQLVDQGRLTRQTVIDSRQRDACDGGTVAGQPPAIGGAASRPARDGSTERTDSPDERASGRQGHGGVGTARARDEGHVGDRVDVHGPDHRDHGREGRRGRSRSAVASSRSDRADRQGDWRP